MSAASTIGGRSRCTGRARRGAMIRSKQSRIAVGSPSRASAPAFRVSASTSSSRSASAMRVALFRQPAARPAGLPDWPLTKWPSGVRSTCFCRRLSGIGEFPFAKSTVPFSLMLPVSCCKTSASLESIRVARLIPLQLPSCQFSNYADQARRMCIGPRTPLGYAGKHEPSRAEMPTERDCFRTAP